MAEKNIALLKRLRTRFLRMRHPQHFNIRVVAEKTSCGTAMCVAGHALDLKGYKARTSFRVTGISQTLYAHTERCVPLLKDCTGDKWRDLPEQSAIRKAFEEHERKLVTPVAEGEGEG